VRTCAIERTLLARPRLYSADASWYHPPPRDARPRQAWMS